LETYRIELMRVEPVEIAGLLARFGASLYDTSQSVSQERAEMTFQNKILTGDCLKWLAKMPEASVDLAFADPPFNIGYEYDQYDDRRACKDYLTWAEQWLAAVRRVLKPTGTFILAIGDEYVAEHKVRLDQLGLTMRNWIVWHYTFGVHCTKKFS